MGKRKPKASDEEKEVKKRRFEEALQAIKNSSSIYKAAKDFGIPRSTLSERNSETTNSFDRERPKILTADEEQRFVHVSNV